MSPHKQCQTDNARHSRRGFSFVELLAVTGLILILMALLIPAVNGAREAARRVQCAYQLQQLGLAFGAYVSAHDVFPPGCVNATGPIAALPFGYHHSWIVQILPYLDERSLYSSINTDLSVYDNAHTTVRGIAPAILNCPSDPTPRVMQGIALSSYAGCHNDVETAINRYQCGVLFLNSAVGYEDILDGSSVTLLAAEKRKTPDQGWMSGTNATLRNSGRSPLKTTAPVFVGPTLPESYHVGTFSSHHRGGILGLMCDGSVHIGGSFDGNRADGEF